MIIFGTGPKYKTVGKGHFYCPHCQTERTYERKQGKQYISLYFIPLIPLGDLGEIIECQTCGRAFSPAVLEGEAPEEPLTLAEMINRAGDLLRDGKPVEYFLRDLTAAGLDRDVARGIIREHIGPDRRTCPACELTYAATVTRCTVCNQPLEKHDA